MLTNLLKYEFMKRWKGARYVLLVLGLIEIVLLIGSKILLVRSDVSNLFMGGNSGENVNVGAPLFFTIFFYFLAIFTLLIFTAIEGAISYEKDLSGKQAPLELMIPAAAWKKITSKLITIISLSIICGLIAIAAVIVFFLVMSNFDKNLIDAMFNGIKQLMSSPINDILIIIEGLFSYASLIILVFFCTAVGKSITHKSKISGFISICVFVACIALIVSLATQAEKFPIAIFSMLGMTSSISSILLDILVFVTTFTATSFLMETKIEN